MAAESVSAPNLGDCLCGTSQWNQVSRKGKSYQDEMVDMVIGHLPSRTCTPRTLTPWTLTP